LWPLLPRKASAFSRINTSFKATNLDLFSPYFLQHLGRYNNNNNNNNNKNNNNNNNICGIHNNKLVAPRNLSFLYKTFSLNFTTI